MYRTLSSILFCWFFCVLPAYTQLKIEYFTEDATCNNNGSVFIIATGGQEPYNYEIIGNTCGLSHRSITANPLFSNLPACTYTFWVIDAMGQVATRDIKVGGNYVGPSASVTVDGCGFSVIAKNGSPPIYYSLSTDGGKNYSPPSDQNTFTGLSNGTYFIKIQDSCKSEFITSATISLDTLEYEFNRVYRSFLTDSITPLALSGGQGPFQFFIVNGMDTLKSAYNTFAMKDIVKTCSTQVVIQSACGRYIHPFKYTDAEIVCLDYSHGKAELKVNVGVAPFTSFYYAPASSGPPLSFPGLLLSGLPVNDLYYAFALRDQCGDFPYGTYETLYRYIDEINFKTADNCGPLDSIKLEIKQNNYFFKNLYTVTCSSCLPVQRFTNIEKSVTLKNLNPGNKTFHIQDNCGTDWTCTSEYIIPIYERCDSIRLSLINAFSCNNRTNGQSYSGDTIAALMYYLRTENGILIDSNSQGIFFGLNNQTYTIQARAAGCGIVETIYKRNLIIKAPDYRIGISRSNDDCKTVYFLNVDYADYPYTLTDSMGVQVIAGIGANSQFGVNFDKIKPGKYVLKSLLTCWQKEILFPDIYPKLTQENITICPAGGSITIRGGKSFNQWQDYYKSLDLDLAYINQPADWYSLASRESKFNYDTATHTFFNIEPGKPYTIYLHSLASVNYTNQLNRCPIDSITIVTPTYTPPSLITDLTLRCDQPNTGLIQLKIKNGTSPYRIQELDCTNQTNIGFSVFTLDTLVTLDHLDPNAHCFKVTDACQNSSTATASPGDQLSKIQLVKNCDSTSSFYTSPIPGATFSWTNKSNVILGDSFKLTIPDPVAGESIRMQLNYKGCMVSSSLLIDSNSLKKLDVRIKADKLFDLCAGDSIQLNSLLEGSVDPIEYHWSTGAVTSSTWIKNAGVQSVRVKNGIGCIDSAQVNIRIGTPLKLAANIKNINCFGDSTGSIKVLPSGGLLPYALNWSTGNSTDSLSKLKAGKYKITLLDIAGCKLDTEFELKQNEKIILSTSSRPATCPVSLDGSVQISPSGGVSGYTYLWSTASTTNPLIKLNPGIYSVTVTDQVLCKTDASIEIFSGPQIQTQRQDTICAGTVLKVGSSIYTVSGNYRDTFKTFQGCDSIVLTRLTINPPLQFLMTAESPICNGQTNGNIVVSGIQSKPPYIFSLNGKTISGFKADQLGPGNYIIKITDGYGCFSEQGASLSNPRKIEFDAGKDSTVKIGDSILLNVVTNLDPNEIRSIQWTSNQGYFCSNCATTLLKPKKDQAFKVELENNSGCKVFDQFLIRVKSEFRVFAPNVIYIHPNSGHELNNRFTLFSDQLVSEIEYLRIFDRFGTILFEARNIQAGDLAAGWDGHFKSQPVASGVYVYVAKIKFADESVQIKSGDLTVLN